MPIPESDVLKQRQEIYESPALRDDLKDSEADVLLKWGETQVERLATTEPEDFEQTCRFLRQLLKNINRFVGQREFNDRAGQEDYMQKVQQWLPKLGYPDLTIDDLFAGLPEDGKDMAGTLQALLKRLTPDAVGTSEQAAPAPKPGGLGAAFIAQTTPEPAATSATTTPETPTPAKPGGLGAAFIAQTTPEPAATSEAAAPETPSPAKAGGLGAAFAAQTTPQATPSAEDEPSVDNPPKPDTIGQTLSSMLGDLFSHDKKGE